MHAQQIDLAAIPDYLFEGYYWYSNAQKPEVIQNEKIDKNKFTSLPFVVEGNFYAKAEKVSIQVKFINGNYLVTRFNFSELDPKLGHMQIYAGHDLKGKNFQVLEAWSEVEDPYLENMKTLQPAWSAFAGFTDKM